MDEKYRIVPNELRERISRPRSGSRESSPMFKDMLEGKTVFVETADDKEARSLNQYYEVARKIGYNLRMRKHVMGQEEGDGEGNQITGRLLWLVKIGE